MSGFMKISFTQNPLYIHNEELSSAEKQSEGKKEDSSPGELTRKLNQINDEIKTLINDLQMPKKEKVHNETWYEVWQEKSTRLKFKINALLHCEPSETYKNGDEATTKKVSAVAQSLLTQLKLVEKQWGMPDGLAIELSDYGISSAAPASPLRSVPVQPQAYAVEFQDEITTIGQDKMTLEEKFWHLLSLFITTIKNGLEHIDDVTVRLYKSNISKGEMHHALRVTFQELLSKKMSIPQGISHEKIRQLIGQMGLPLDIKDGELVFNSSVEEIKTKLASLGIKVDGSEKFPERSHQTTMGDINNEIHQLFPMQNAIKVINENYPSPQPHENGNNTLNNWLNTMIGPFNSIDKININFYKSIISLVTAWQGKMNEFREKFAEVIKSSAPPHNFDDKKFHFSGESVRAMTRILGEIDVIKEQAALILGDVTVSDIYKLLEGTGIKLKEKIGTVAVIDLGDDLTNMLKKAIDSCFSEYYSGDYLVSSEQLTQFQKTLDQSKEQFDSTTKKVGTKADHTTGVFKSTQEAISNLLSQMIALLSELSKNIR
jgi:hypothetical protein